MGREKKRRVHPPTLAKAREMRKPQTPAEKKLWRRLRKVKLEGFKFRRQQAIGHFIADFYCAKSKLIVEIDGDTHAEHTAYDVSRTMRLMKRGYQVMRFTNSDVHSRLTLVLEAVLAECKRRAEPSKRR